MNQSNNPNPYEQYSYDHYDQAPRANRSSRRGASEPTMNFEFLNKFRSPLFATISLLVVGAAFAGIIIASYPDSKESEDVPVVHAQLGPYKSAPDDPGGMNVPHRDSTIFSALDESGMAERPPVENLLDQEAPVDKLAAFSKDVEEIIKTDEANAAATAPAQSELSAAGEAPEAEDISETEPASGAEAAAKPVETSVDETTAPATVAAADKVEVKTIIQETEKITPQELIAESEAASPKPQTLHAPASSPETIAFVRSVLDKKDTQKVLSAPASNGVAPDVAEAQAANIAETMNEVKPASGTPPTASAPVTPGNYYIQLGSVKTKDGAAGEWSKLQKSFSSNLQGLEYRVQEANLGDRGTFFRIQAGPVSKDSAGSICESIKAQKPGACLVVQ